MILFGNVLPILYEVKGQNIGQIYSMTIKALCKKHIYIALIEENYNKTR